LSGRSSENTTLHLEREYELPTYDAIQAWFCADRLHDYIQRAWPIVEPGVTFVDGWHIRAICDHLEAAYRREIRNLIINVPPRHMKSLCVSVMFPTWVWGPKEQPHERFLCASYAESLAIRDSLKCRHIIQHPWYRKLWGDVFELNSDQNQKTRFENNRTGYRLAVGVGGSSTGEGGDYILVDDPLKAQDCDSEAALNSTNEWWDGTLSTRGNDPKTLVRIVIMQRLAENDLTGHILEKMKHEGAEQWEVLCLPAEYEPKPYVSTIGWEDPRSDKGDLLWPERYDKQSIQELKVNLGPRHAAGQLQQRPAPAGGAIFHREWWESENRFHILSQRHKNAYVARWLSMDTAFEKSETSAFTACVWFDLRPNYQVTVTNVVRERLEFPELLAFTERQIGEADRDERLRGVIIENQASGKSLLQTLHRTLVSPLREMVIAYDPQGSKKERQQRAAVWCQKGCVLLPQPHEACPWLLDFEEELYKVPASTYQDQADAFAQGVDYLSNYLEQGFRVRTQGVDHGTV
jgi:phage terminase large subunit-like protein